MDKTKLVQEWFAQQVLLWPPRGADLRLIENMGAETMRIMVENVPVPSLPRQMLSDILVVK